MLHIVACLSCNYIYKKNHFIVQPAYLRFLPHFQSVLYSSKFLKNIVYGVIVWQDMTDVLVSPNISTSLAAYSQSYFNPQNCKNTHITTLFVLVFLHL